MIYLEVPIGATPLAVIPYERIPPAVTHVYLVPDRRGDVPASLTQIPHRAPANLAGSL